MLGVDAVASAIDAQFPQLAPARVSYLGEGYDSTAFDVNETWVFRFPKRSDVEQQLVREMSALRVLAPSAPAAVPVFSFHGQPSPQFPRQFGGYVKIPGILATEIDAARIAFERVAPSLARFLSWLHAFPVDDVARLGVPEQPFDTVLDEVRTEALDDFELVSQVAPAVPLDEWHAYLKDGVDVDSRRERRGVIVHNDLAAEHILLDATSHSVTGIIDWSDMAIGGIELDLAVLFHWGGEPLAHAVMSTYQGRTDDRVLRRARFLAACRGVGDVKFGLEMNRPDYIAGGIRALEMSIGTEIG